MAVHAGTGRSRASRDMTVICFTCLQKITLPPLPSAETRQGIGARPRTRTERGTEGGRTLFSLQSLGERKTINHQIEMLRTTLTKGSFRS
jgi:hypothetical protein